MPTFDDPLKDAAEASAALRGLAHATRTFENPSDTYPVIGELLAGVRSLRQVLDQLAAAHLRSRGVAHDDAGNQAAGATSALGAADELHQAGTLLDTVDWRLDAASQHSGRIAWRPDSPVPAAEAGRTTVTAGRLVLTVWPDEPLGEHHRYAYRIEGTATGESIEGRDLFTGTGAPVSPSEALRELAGHLIDAAQAYYQALEDGGPATESGGPFPVWVADAALHGIAYLSDLHDLGPQDPNLDPAGSPEEAGPRWISVVFLEGSEADEVLDLIARKGTDAAIEHLAGHDYGEETTQAALENGYVYDEPPRGPLDKVATRDVYTLTYSPFLGHVSLLREHSALPDPALLGIDTPAPAPAEQRAGRTLAPASRRERPGGEWFTRQPGTASAQGRGLAL